VNIGSLGDIVFQVDNSNLFTFSGLARGRAARFPVHNVMRGRPKAQHNGRELDTLSFTVQLHEFPGSRERVDERIRRILEMADQGLEQSLVFGQDYWGAWVIKSAGVEHRQFHAGVTLSARIALELMEYN
jgi:phage protein U